MTYALTGAEGGRWLVRTIGSIHRFDLEAMTVTRIPGKDSAATLNDQTRPLIQIVHCTVGARGYWLMSPEPDESEYVEHFWHLSSTIQSIEPAVDDDPDRDIAPRPDPER
ncbi:hypothetical protein E3O06_01675 [Cryobacterium glaciale]|uniref:Uncharacterized protein n=1 Tax=Cryobacterium glaciale TaxID=1259145 RepID=A0A4R8V4Z6_9MICO|nr:hypothetical protein [Cryobacterium glaciale]TFB76739.1 hypothetical protein E3O06_01675 [Cryobacterium glaciale]